MQPSPRTHSKKAAGGLAATAAVCGLLTWLVWSPNEDSAIVARPDARGPLSHADAATGAAQAPVVRNGVEQRAGYYTAPVGTVLTYTLHGHCDYMIAQAEAGNESSTFQFHGTLAVVIADRRDDEILTEVTLAEIALSPRTGGAMPAHAVAKARTPFHVRLGADGAVLGYRFPDCFAGEERNFMRSLFSAYTHRVPADAHGTWESKDADGAGELMARFTLAADSAGDAVHVERRRLRYLAMSGDELHPHQLTGQSQATFSRALGWITTVDVDERMRLELAALSADFAIHSVFHFALRAHGTQTPGPSSGLWDEAWLPAAGHRENLTAGGAQADRDHWRNRLAGASLPALTQALAALLAADPQDAQAIDTAWHSISGS
jgi:hypothetical protein